MITVAVSGGFDPLHVGHLHYLQAAKALGDRLVVILNSDDWLVQKKGYAFMPEGERAEILLGLRYVDEIYILHSMRNDVSEALLKVRPAIFAKGGDRSIETLPMAELDACHAIGAKVICGVGGDEKLQSSSWLVDKAKLHC